MKEQAINLACDAGYGFVKYDETGIFPAALIKCASQPFRENRIIEYDGQAYELASQPIGVVRDKMADEQMLLLTLVAIAKYSNETETIKQDEVTGGYNLKVNLGVGLPLKNMRLKENLVEYYKAKELYIFQYEAVTFRVTFSRVEVYPQGFAGLVYSGIGRTLSGRVVVADVGYLTVDVLEMYDQKVSANTVFSLEEGVSKLVANIQHAAENTKGIRLECGIVLQMLDDPDRDLELSELLVGLAKLYIENIENQLFALGYSRCTYLIVGGGASVMKRFQSGRFKQVQYVEDSFLNVKGYKLALERKKCDGK